MEIEKLIAERVHTYYWEYDLNCAVTTLKTLGEIYSIDIHPQVIESAAGMHGAGGYGAQCGLVEGGLMFIGLAGAGCGRSTENRAGVCKKFASGFEERFGSLECRVLRPEGFRENQPPHLCEELSRKTILYASRFIGEYLDFTH